jgi:hypothetical protein
MNSPFLPTRLEQVFDLRTAAVNNHDVHADELEENDVARKTLLEVLVGHRVAAILDDNGLAVETFDVRQCLGENGGCVGGSDPAVGHGGVPDDDRRILPGAGANKKASCTQGLSTPSRPVTGHRHQGMMSLVESRIADQLETSAIVGASRPRRPGRCTSARWSPPWAATWTRVPAAASGCCASKTSTSRGRCAGAADGILRTLAGFGFEWDGEVVVQSRRLDLYRAALVDRLQVRGDAYRLRLLATRDRRLYHRPDGGGWRAGLPRHLPFRSGRWTNRHAPGECASPHCEIVL